VPSSFEEMTLAQVHARAAGEGGVTRGKRVYADRPWTELRDEMMDCGVRTVGDLPRARVQELRTTTKSRPAS
jgi:hypothetical protein